MSSHFFFAWIPRFIIVLSIISFYRKINYFKNKYLRENMTVLLWWLHAVPPHIRIIHNGTVRMSLCGLDDTFLYILNLECQIFTSECRWYTISRATLFVKPYNFF
jgi:hypothetical protein